MVGALDNVNEVHGKLLTFNDVMNQLRDTVTLLKKGLWQNTPSPSGILTAPLKEPIIGNVVAHHHLHSSPPSKKRVQSLRQSLETRLHKIVQHLLYFRNVDGSFGEPIVKQSTR